IATYSKAYGAKVLSNQSNIHLSQSDLTFSAITFNGVTFKDEGCYSCIFNTFPLGPISGKTCLEVYGNCLKKSLQIHSLIFKVSLTLFLPHIYYLLLL
uniref:Uncharacterized protein n=1 Tax=Naja naja TaxID=35670 RepID=A0A8C6X6Z5_NAJNA